MNFNDKEHLGETHIVLVSGGYVPLKRSWTNGVVAIEMYRALQMVGETKNADDIGSQSVSYTHLTLPTKRIV